MRTLVPFDQQRPSQINKHKIKSTEFAIEHTQSQIHGGRRLNT